MDADMSGTGWSGMGRAPRAAALAVRPPLVSLLAVLFFGPSAALAVEPNPFLPPVERAAEIEARLQKRIDLAVAAVEERLMKTVVDALGSRDAAGAPKPSPDPAPRRAASANTSLPPGLPGLPPLPGLPGGIGQGGASNGPALASATPEPVPAGAVFIGCLDGKAFFQDRAGSPFLVDPRAFPPSSGGAGACGR